MGWIMAMNTLRNRIGNNREHGFELSAALYNEIPQPYPLLYPMISMTEQRAFLKFCCFICK